MSARFRLPLFNRGIGISNNEGLPSPAFHRWWQDAADRIEIAINGIQDALTAAGIALSAADAANSAAQSAGAVGRITNSGTTGLTLTASTSGSSSSISVSNHTRIYGDGTSVSVTGSTISLLVPDTTYAVFYDDPTFSGGTVSYQTTSNLNSVSQTGARHIVGVVKTPATGAPPSEGAGPRQPGFNFDIP